MYSERKKTNKEHSVEKADGKRNFWEGLNKFEALPDRPRGIFVATPEKVARLWGEMRMQEPLAGRSMVMANFVQTIDGVGSYGVEGYAGGGAISKSAADRWMMDVWRTHTDAILLGAETIRAEDAEFKKKIREGKLDFRIDGRPINGFAVTVEDPELAEWRKNHKGSRHPLLAVFSGSGVLPENLGIFDLRGQEIAIFTTPAGEKKLRATIGRERLGDAALIAFAGERKDLPAYALGILNRDFGVSYLVAEGGPNTIGDFLRADLLDEIVVTTAPRLGYGKDARGNYRKRIFEGGMNFYPSEALADPDVRAPADAQPAPEFEEVSFRRYGDHNFSRYWRKRKE